MTYGGTGGYLGTGTQTLQTLQTQQTQTHSTQPRHSQRGQNLYPNRDHSNKQSE